MHTNPQWVLDSFPMNPGTSNTTLMNKLPFIDWKRRREGRPGDKAKKMGLQTANPWEGRTYLPDILSPNENLNLLIRTFIEPNKGNKGNIDELTLQHLNWVKFQRLPPYELLYIFLIQGCMLKIKDERRWADGLLIYLMKTR